MTNQISKAFNEAVDTYDSYACVQRYTAQSFAHKLSEVFGNKKTPKRLLEIGCGTGLLTRELLVASPFDALHITDLAEKMVAHCNASFGHDSRLSFAVMDGQKLDEVAEFDYVVSNLTFQWFDCLVTTLERLLHTSPYVAFTTFGNQSFLEWKKMCEILGVSNRLRHFPTTDELIGDISKFATIDIQRETLTRTYRSWLEFWQSIKAIGAHRGIGDPTLELKHWRLLETGEVSVTFEIFYCFIERR